MSGASPDLHLDTEAPVWGTWGLVGSIVLAHLVTSLLLAPSGQQWAALVYERSPQLRVALGGQRLDELVQGEWWRLATSVWLHGDLLHLSVNALSIYALGRLLEPVLGTARLVAWFALGGIGASAVCWGVGVAQSDGASGGAFALAAAAAWLGLRHTARWAPRDRTLMGPVMVAFLGLNYVVGWLIPGIDVVAHTAGLLIGAGLAALDPVRRPHPRPYVATGLMAVAGCLYGWLRLALG